MVIKNRLIPDGKVYYYYMLKHTGQIFEIGKKFSSPTRPDNDPSWSTKQREDGKVIWRDFGSTKIVGNDCVAFVQDIYNISRKDAKTLIYNDIILGDPPIPPISDAPKTDSTDYKLEHRPLKSWELPYWHKIRNSTLDKFKVVGVEYCEMKGLPSMSSFIGHPTYAYIFGPDSFQLYRPSQHRFKSWNIYNCLFGWEQLPEKGLLLIITSSMKDVMTLNEIGLRAIAPSSEGAYRYLLSKMDELNERFDDILILYDSDPPGVAFAELLEDKTDWEPLFPVFPRNMKDPSDILWKYDEVKLIQTLRTARHPILNKYI